MNSLKKDYRKLYQLQDRFLLWWQSLSLPFYLTGGTALGRFYLNHRFSEDLDFFVNADQNYSEYIKKIIKEIPSVFHVTLENALFTEDFTRIIINEEGSILKLEFINDVAYRSGELKKTYFGLIDTPFNILSNKLTALVGRDEPKDIFDIVNISKTFSFNWIEIFNEAKNKSVINEIDVEERLSNFPLKWLENVDWLNNPVDFNSFKVAIAQIADDFLLGKENTLCDKDCLHIHNAKLI